MKHSLRFVFHFNSYYFFLLFESNINKRSDGAVHGTANVVSDTKKMYLTTLASPSTTQISYGYSLISEEWDLLRHYLRKFVYIIPQPFRVS